MIGATVQVKGTGTGTITSIDGDYSLNDVAKDAVLVFSSIGYEDVYKRQHPIHHRSCRVIYIHLRR